MRRFVKITLYVPSGILSEHGSGKQRASASPLWFADCPDLQLLWGGSKNNLVLHGQ